MPVTFNQVLADRVEMVMATAGDDLHITYRPRSMTPRAMKAMALLDELTSGRAKNTTNADVQVAMDALTAALAGTLIDWDMEYPDPETGEANGVKIPPTVEGLQDVDYVVQMTVYQAIQSHMSHSKPSGRKSPKA